MKQRKTPKPKQDANAVTNAVVKWLNLNGYRAWRQNNTGVFDPTAAKRQIRKCVESGLRGKQLAGSCSRAIDKAWRKNTGVLGLPDVIGVNLKTGRWIGVEVKVGTDKLRPEQKHFLQMLRDAGAEWYIARDSEGFINNWCHVNQKASPFARKGA